LDEKEAKEMITTLIIIGILIKAFCLWAFVDWRHKNFMGKVIAGIAGLLIFIAMFGVAGFFAIIGLISLITIGYFLLKIKNNT
jgi:hypothetical protein